MYMLRSSDWNAHIHDVPPPDEDPEPEDGNPHPFYGEILTAEQLFQQQVAFWLQQNGFHANHPANNAPMQQVNHQAVVVPAPEPAPVVD